MFGVSWPLYHGSLGLGVVVINQACYSRLVVWMNCFVIDLTVDVKVVFSVCLYWIDFHYESCL